MSFWAKLKAFIGSANELDTGDDGYVIPASNSGVLPIADSEPLDSDATSTALDSGVVIDLPSISSSMNEGKVAAPTTAAQTKGLMMFNFNHTEEELRFIIQSVEAKIQGMQAFLQKLITSANAQAQIQNGQPAPAPSADPTPTITVPVAEADPTSVDLTSADAGTVTVSS